ncbi:MAG: NAD(P)/FAD-dependent oxidoreductase, partial [Thermoanaerobaculia bacterium]
MLVDKPETTPEWDAIIVGGGPGGLSAALWLGRCRRRLLLVDAGGGRNAVAHGIHGLLTRDGLTPEELRRLGRQELEPYGVEYRSSTVTAARRSTRGFEVTLETGELLASRALVLATGVRDRLPRIDGFEAFYGATVHHCPYCDGWEHRDQK